ncbi:hypothetical protein ILUMI_27379 [Ignelater luminosus]|uniref:Heat shock protein 70 n=1 Tax=Ignelater luminosus TaxID=2038154 RepID=A0A8K0C377_IGNLU|nr:hypothetical protein ILUMI_27379 [Ignelater luminosus]
MMYIPLLVCIKMVKIALGIDLGTTNSCVAVYQNEKVEILQNEYHTYVTPSWVGFTENGIITGHEAKNEAYKNIPNTIFEVKRLIGQSFNNKHVLEDIKKFSYKVINNHGMVKIKVKYQDKKEEYFPEEISAFILENLRSLAESHFGQKITNVVITVPAYFNDYQRQATKNAGIIAGFQTVNVINEPTAAALAFNYQHSKAYKRNVMVYDFGGGTFDVSIVTIEKGKCKVRATKGDLHLGGTDINTNLVNFVKNNFKRQYNTEIIENEATMRRLRARCEKVKEQLSGRTAVEIDLDNLSGRDYFTYISRAEFEELNSELFNTTLEIVEDCLKHSGLTKSQIDEVVLVGGSSRIPKVQEMLIEYFGEDKINKGVNPDEAVAYGAAIHADGLSRDKNEIEDVISLSLGIAVLSPNKTEGHRSDKIIPSNTQIPTTITKQYFTKHKFVSIMVYQGEAYYAADNFLLGEFVLSGLKRSLLKSSLSVCFDVNSEGILKVIATETGSSNRNSIQINIKSHGLTSQQILHRMEKMDQHRIERNKKLNFALEVYNLEKFYNSIVKESCSIKDKQVKLMVLEKCKEVFLMLENVTMGEKEGIDKIKKELEHLNTIVKKQ